LQFVGERRKRLAELGEVEGQRIGLDLDAHEVALPHFRRFVGVEAGFEDPALVLGDEAGDAAMMPTWSGQEAVRV
jgi:hypothetical protein